MRRYDTKKAFLIICLFLVGCISDEEQRKIALEDVDRLTNARLAHIKKRAEMRAPLDEEIKKALGKGYNEFSQTEGLAFRGILKDKFSSIGVNVLDWLFDEEIDKCILLHKWKQGMIPTDLQLALLTSLPKDFVSSDGFPLIPTRQDLSYSYITMEFVHRYGSLCLRSRSSDSAVYGYKPYHLDIEYTFYFSNDFLIDWYEYYPERLSYKSYRSDYDLFYKYESTRK